MPSRRAPKEPWYATKKYGLVTREELAIAAATEIMITQAGDDPKREGLIKTPLRVARAMREMYAGYRQNPGDLLKAAQFVEGACKELVVVRNLRFYSTCEHHMVPFFGSVDVGYIPNGKVVGLSKLGRLVDCFARRLQIQEKMTAQVADAMMEHLKCKGVMVVARGKHLCMMARGVRKEEAEAVTSAIRGIFVRDKALRAEFLSLTRGGHGA